jgi:hypothetical protein
MRLIFFVSTAFLLFAIDAPTVSAGGNWITPLNGWVKYACTAENIKVR